jgi:hypothetical protein
MTCSFLYTGLGWDGMKWNIMLVYGEGRGLVSIQLDEMVESSADCDV